MLNKLVNNLNTMTTQRQKLLAFTLAEVIITLGIVGIVAEITIPDLVYSMQKQLAVTQVKEAYSILSQATARIKTDCGGDLTGCLASTTLSAASGDVAAGADLASVFKQKLFISLDCPNGTKTGCFSGIEYNNGNYNYLNNTAYDDVTHDNQIAKMLLTDGMAVGFAWVGISSPTMVFDIFVDVNGKKPPNTVGKDTFLFYYDSNKQAIVPCSANDCGTGTNQGFGCANKILQESTISYY